MRLTDTIWIRSSPERLFGFFEHMDANYLRWHPDHRAFRWEEGRGVRSHMREEGENLEPILEA